MKLNPEALEIESFTAGAEPYDDLTVLVVRWRGPDGVLAPPCAVG